MGKIKGIVLLETVKLLRRHAHEARELLPAEHRRYLEEDIELSAWYPETDAAVLFSRAAQLLPGGGDRALELMGETAARAHHEIYRGLLSGPGSSSRAFALWSNQHDTGELRRIREAPNVLRFELSDFEDTSRELCLIIGGYLKGAAAMSGRSSAMVTKLACRLWGDERCNWVATWISPDSDRTPGAPTELFEVPGTVIVEHYPRQRALVAAWESVRTSRFREVVERGLTECARLAMRCWIADLTRCPDLPREDDALWIETTAAPSCIRRGLRGLINIHGSSPMASIGARGWTKAVREDGLATFECRTLEDALALAAEVAAAHP